MMATPDAYGGHASRERARQAYIASLSRLARERIETSYHQAIAEPAATLPSIYRAFNLVAANLVDAMHRTAADDDPGDLELVAEAEREIFTACQRRAAELIDGELPQ